MATSASKFFSLVVPVCALVVTVSVMASNTNLLSKASNSGNHTQKFEFVEGTNHFSPVLQTTSTAKDLCQKVAATNIWHWYNKPGRDPVIENFDCLRSTDSSNFVFTPYHGYAVDITTAGTFSISGKKAGSETILVDMPTMYFYSLPESVSNNLKADHICKRFTDGKLSVSNVWNYLGGDNWEEYVCSDPTSLDFGLEYGKPNFFLMQVNGKSKLKTDPGDYFK